MKQKIKVVAAVIIADGKVLVGQREKGRILEDRWEFPGGKVNSGETLQAALKREIQEELGDQLSISERVFETAVIEHEFATIELTLFYAKLLSYNLQLHAHTKLKWVFPNELAQLDWIPGNVPLVKRLIKNLKKEGKLR
ncbi:(deoxy)nucleoside triphosphate pyrophosphohydrolase [Liquorilactobacillus oeni]|uniref:8-oxo-dGTP diphosphatase n=1 Tax=Liquorilactobacillus oeni DSM 19972 TaxID=1423777 RepID=A0A0R1MN84_9LACO|nr:(deoxy)nucleoside triphosphate pyrophosphohydrolase [Liquorilactobacillus oeni]KRL05448.1 hypothetical protein FD46_GL000863 [Liquorilactobacillus oeni DSM 19972]